MDGIISTLQSSTESLSEYFNTVNKVLASAMNLEPLVEAKTILSQLHADVMENSEQLRSYLKDCQSEDVDNDSIAKLYDRELFLEQSKSELDDLLSFRIHQFEEIVRKNCASSRSSIRSKNCASIKSSIRSKHCSSSRSSIHSKRSSQYSHKTTKSNCIADSIELKFRKQKLDLEQCQLQLDIKMNDVKLAEVEAYERFEAESVHSKSVCLDKVTKRSDKNVFRLDSIQDFSKINVASAESVKVEPEPNSDSVDIKSALNCNAEPFYGNNRIHNCSSARLPLPKPPIFSGKVIEFPAWKVAFEALVINSTFTEQERFYFLKSTLAGEALECIEHMFLLDAKIAYPRALRRLEDRYGNPVSIAKEFSDRLSLWKRIGSFDSKSLRSFSDYLQQCIIAKEIFPCLNILDSEKENCLLCAKLPDWLSNRWVRFAADFRMKNRSFPSFVMFCSFIEKESDIACDPILSMKSIHDARKDQIVDHPRNHSRNTKQIYSHDISTKTIVRKCVSCAKDHLLYKCEKFSKLPLLKRKELVKSNNLCDLCLRGGHKRDECKFKLTCRECNGAHQTLLHDNRFNKSATLKNSYKFPVDNSSNVEVKDIITHFSCQKDKSKCSMILPVYVSHKSNPNKEVLIYALLDSMSDSTFITNDVLKELDVNGISINLSLSTLSSENTIVPSVKVSGLQTRGYYKGDCISLPPVYSSKNIPANREHIPTYDKIKSWSHLKFLRGKLPPDLECPVGMIIGFDCPDALLPKQVTPSVNFAPFAQLTQLGWGVVGCVGRMPPNNTSICHNIVNYNVFDKTGLEVSHHSSFCFRTVTSQICSPSDIYNMLEYDFKDGDQNVETLSIQDKRFVNILEDNICREGNKYSMPLPFKNQDKPLMPCNKSVALSRLTNLKKKLTKDDKYYQDYSQFMNKLIENKHAEKVPFDELDNSGHTWYLPHHGVYNARKPDKIRVVFDGSVSFNNVVLNDMLLKGPDLNNSLIGVLIRFRKEVVAFTCDIEQMFYNFFVEEGFRDYLRFLWYENGILSQPPTVYRMNKHMFGATSSPSCANFALKQLSKDYKSAKNEKACSFIETGFYVDDGLISVSNDLDAINLVNDTVALCREADLNLHKFSSNSPAVMRFVKEKFSSEVKKDLPTPSLERLLGVEWCIQSDTFQFRITISKKPLTRRGLLSIVSSIYDPLGFISPYMLEGKKILQCMCTDKCSWDDDISDILLPRWTKWLRFISNLEKVRVSRCLHATPDVVKAELHHFGDASVVGYGQCSYLRVIDSTNNVTCSLVMGKSRVSPLKSVTIPRLELTASLLTCKISKLINKELCMNDIQNYYWTDSKCVLSYIKNETSRFHIFVANRVQQIRDLTSLSDWRYIPTDLNPADDASRGLSLEHIDNTCRWFCGPEFLHNIELTNFETQHVSIKDDDPEVKPVKCYYSDKTYVTSKCFLLESLANFSSWFRAKRAVANCKRFINICYSKAILKRKTSMSKCTANDIADAETIIIKLVQSHYFNDELCSLKVNKTVAKSSSLNNLNVMLNSDGVIRVGGRLKDSSISFHEKHPIIMPSAKVCYISKLLIMFYHEKSHHQGRGITVNTIRRAGYWIISLISCTASVLYNCVLCRKLYKLCMEQKMSDLPRDRTEDAPPFTFAAVDIFGPYIVKSYRKTVKRYAVLFTCLCCRAVHIEVAHSLTTDSFINAFRRFVSVRGTVSSLRSDCGTNFIGSERELRFELDNIDNEQVRSFLLKESCEYKFNVPGASHAGGVWERQIRSVRRVMSSLIKEAGDQLCDESLHTFLCEAAAIINSRPLSVENISDTEFLPISPNSFLTMKPSIVMPPPGEFLKEELYSKRRWKRVQYLSGQFWLKWRKEYLQNLQLRKKWTKSCHNLKVNDIVMIKDANAARLDWHLCRVEKVFSGSDNLVRSATLLVGKRGSSTKRSYLNRPIQKLILILEAE